MIVSEGRMVCCRELQLSHREYNGPLFLFFFFTFLPEPLIVIGFARFDNLNVGHRPHNDASTVTVMPPAVVLSDCDGGKSGRAEVLYWCSLDPSKYQTRIEVEKKSISGDEG